ncbi:MAG: DUF4395 domain-containing protein, partial [Spirochaetales bacterium]|nr:DUF4395 domain-containing protein [Spirochaetales bacterium]
FILAVDFFIRAILTPRFSLLAFISRKLIVPVAGFRRRMIMFKPKRFAAGIGLFMTGASLIFHYYDITFIFIVFMSILILFSFLETFLKFCAGCKIFGILIKLEILDEEECTDCKFEDGSGI